MPKRPPGRPKATNPLNRKMSLRLTKEEADLLQRFLQGGSISEFMRASLRWYLSDRSSCSGVPGPTEHCV